MEPGYDAVLQAEGGLMSITGSPDGPPVRVGVAIADIVTGMFAAQGITLALYARERTGRGQLVDISMLDTVAALLTYQAGIYFATDVPPVRLGNRHPTIVPYETFAARGRRIRAGGGQRRPMAPLLRRGRPRRGRAVRDQSRPGHRVRRAETARRRAASVAAAERTGSRS